ncbi:Hsp70 family protein [Chondromyces apiculatus]|uniref:Putative heat shock protein n=1 Tax=Chondromyces apiculatus DSM 436 TaxID=1192034 RepID=A0A017T1S3_9BACT|nr:Hsp70 family protein [Chondromyces apiculatus]EYF03209.1 putative heat shock protein [Chondromyces apiculatus DSM 436]
MRLGIDFGTTRTVVACSDRGNYPVLSFQDETGNPVDWYPSVIAERKGELRFGFEAIEAAADPEWTVLRSFKRLLAGPRTSPDFQVEIGSTTLSGVELIARFLDSLRRAILTRSNRPAARGGGDDTGDRLVSVVATPANAHGAQRFITLDAFHRAGFEVTALLNEPSAAGFEYSHRYHNTLSSRREHIVVYDLGGGTFDASLVHISGRRHEAITTAGSSLLGGDDFDAALVHLVLEQVGLTRGGLPPRALSLLIDQCREAKERLNPSSRRIVIDLESCLGDLAPAPEVTASVADYYDRCMPLVQRSIEAMQPVMAHLEAKSRTDDAMTELAGIYVVGGASSLPVVGRVLREVFGRRVHRSPYPSAAVAIGLAIAVDDEAGFELSDRLSRHFGVFRESDSGRDVVFDPIFGRDARVPGRHDPATVHRRVYRAAHNVGRYRFVECGDLDPRGVPLGDITAFDAVYFPFDRGVRHLDGKLSDIPVTRLPGEGPLIQEEYAITRHGLVRLTITDLEAGYQRAYDVGAAATAA